MLRVRKLSEIEKVRSPKYLSLDDAAAFHGHRGPFLVIGYRAGRYGVKILRPETEFDLETEVHIPFKTPFSCILDGLQCATKCTLGKKNIRCIDSKSIDIIIINKKTKKKIEFILREEYLKKFLDGPIEKAVQISEKEELEKIFVIKK